jgi:predicted enzyme related to lactoylglutathione lyase
MIKTLNIVGIWVRDQDEALEFYVTKLGFEKRQDMPMGPARWLTVAPPDQRGVEIALQQPVAAWHGAENVAKLRRRVGQSTTWSYGTDDCQKTYEEYRARGVTFTSPPTEQMYGIEAVCQDLYGNSISIVQLSESARQAMEGATAGAQR